MVHLGPTISGGFSAFSSYIKQLPILTHPLYFLVFLLVTVLSTVLLRDTYTSRTPEKHFLTPTSTSATVAEGEEAAITSIAGTMTAKEGATVDSKGNIKVDDKIPTQKELAKAGDIEVFDREKKAYKFSSLFMNIDGVKTKYLVLFIRHFFCGNCQEYIRHLSLLLPPSSLPTSPPTSVIVIGCGEPHLIDQYIANTNCPYPLYADPSRELYDVLRMTCTLSLGSKAPKYMENTNMWRIISSSVWSSIISKGQIFHGGKWSQVGGEFVFEKQGDGDLEPTWCRRMRNTRDHAEVEDIRKALGIDNAFPEQGASQTALSGQKSIEPTPAKKNRWSSIGSLGGGVGRRLSKRNQRDRASWHPDATKETATTNGHIVNDSATNGHAASDGPT